MNEENKEALTPDTERTPLPPSLSPTTEPEEALAAPIAAEPITDDTTLSGGSAEGTDAEASEHPTETEPSDASPKADDSDGSEVPPADEKKPSSKKLISGIFDYLELFAWSVCAVLLIFTFGVRLCRVDGQSMENTLYHNQNLLLYSAFYEPEQGDIVVFHLTKDGMQKTLVKRVIATGGQTVVIDTNARTVTVDGILYDDPNAVLKIPRTDIVNNLYNLGLFDYGMDYETGIFQTTVPQGKVFVLGDNRNNSADSRDYAVGFVDERCILGKVVLRFAPFTVFN